MKEAAALAGAFAAGVALDLLFGDWAGEQLVRLVARLLEP